MKTEYEVKILDINVKDIENKLKILGAKKLKVKNMRRYVYDVIPKKENTWIRLRDTGEKTTLTIKEFTKDSIDGTREIELKVNDFDTAHELLKKLGFLEKAYQENKRISHLLNGVKIEIDSWPKIPPYLEIEGNSEEEVEKMIETLNFDKSQTTSMNVEQVYKKYNIDIHSFKKLKF